MRGISAFLLAAACLFAFLCVTTDAADVDTAQITRPNYPLVVEATGAKRRRSETAWRSWLESNRAPLIAGDLHPALGVPRTLPAELAQKILLTEKSEALSLDGVKEALRQFIVRAIRVLAGDPQERALGLQDLSLFSLSEDGNFYRATYRQMNFGIPVGNGYGELKFAVTRQGALLQMTSRLLPVVNIPTVPIVDIAPISAALVGRSFQYRGIDGRELDYRVATREEVSAKDPVIYPREDGERLLLHLAYPVEVGRGLTWTVFVDAITGQEIEVKQNFNT